MVAERRTVLQWGVAATLGLALPGATAVVASRRAHRRPQQAALPASAPGAAFRMPLPIPAVLRPTSTTGGVDRYELRQVEGRQQVVPDGPATTVWGYDGVFPGPTIEVRRGRAAVVTHHNRLPVPTVVHLHGGKVSAEADGYPVDFVLPEADQGADREMAAMARLGVAGLATGTRAYVYANDQPAATLWYHDHRMSFTGPQVYRGLAGFYIVRDDVEDALSLPRGARDIPLMITDRTFAEDNSLRYPSVDPLLLEPGVTVRAKHGWLGDTNVVNGVAWPFHEVDAALYRLRVCNASNARPYMLKLDPPPPGGGGLVQIGSDVGLLSRPIHFDTITISPGERYDLLVDFSAWRPGTQVVLKNNFEQGPKADLVRFDIVRRATDDARIPDTLAPDQGPSPPSPDRVGDRRFNFTVGPEGTGLPALINFRAFDLRRIDARPTLGTTEVWNVTADANHPVHLHMAHFRILSRDGKPPAPQDTGWKDTVFVHNSAVKLAVAFTGHRGKTVFHCHNLEHGDNGMMANIEVV
ncbi:MAG: multicopper oxidase family protein [Carbonactinosporaceae bacterium]